MIDFVWILRVALAIVTSWIGFTAFITDSDYMVEMRRNVGIEGDNPDEKYHWYSKAIVGVTFWGIALLALFL